MQLAIQGPEVVLSLGQLLTPGLVMLEVWGRFYKLVSAIIYR
jgi:hypothetical protein